jgi:hypothetical protein
MVAASLAAAMVVVVMVVRRADAENQSCCFGLLACRCLQATTNV